MILPLSKTQAPVYEIFFSFQGEALYTGLPQIFVRFAGCNIKCNYCDTLYSTVISKGVKYLTCDKVLDKIDLLYKENKKKFTFGKPSIALTGGEPLIHAKYLEELLPKLKEKGFSTYLETNGSLPQKLRKVVKFCDIISMDFKFESECKKSLYKEHKLFLKIAKDNVDTKVFIKCVITKNTNILEIKKSVNLIKNITKETTLVLQPSIDIRAPAIENLHKFYVEAKKSIPNVHLMVQMHKIYKLA
ncbi:7-carboxy-7-deazaguanine synthase [Endomicrobiia bacterium]|nr:7-carboxy-7-deazaguanine synthase [Endomicrobiia bacterium]